MSIRRHVGGAAPRWVGRRQQFVTTARDVADLASDDRRIAYVDADGVNITRLDSDRVTTVATTALARAPTWSPDGTSLAWIDADDPDSPYGVRVWDGTKVDTLTEQGASSVAWTADGEQLIVARDLGRALLWAVLAAAARCCRARPDGVVYGPVWGGGGS